MVDLEVYGMTALEIHAAHLNAICVPERSAAISYDILADALVWSDETIKSTPIAVIQGRCLKRPRSTKDPIAPVCEDA